MKSHKDEDPIWRGYPAQFGIYWGNSGIIVSGCEAILQIYEISGDTHSYLGESTPGCSLQFGLKRQVQC